MKTSKMPAAQNAALPLVAKKLKKKGVVPTATQQFPPKK